MLFFVVVDGEIDDMADGLSERLVGFNEERRFAGIEGVSDGFKLGDAVIEPTLEEGLDVNVIVGLQVGCKNGGALIVQVGCLEGALDDGK